MEMYHEFLDLFYATNSCNRFLVYLVRRKKTKQSQRHKTLPRV